MRSVLSGSFRFKATGETPAFLESNEGRLDDIPSESFYSGVIGGTLRLYFHAQHYNQYTGVSRINLTIGSTGKRWSTDGVVIGAET